MWFPDNKKLQEADERTSFILLAWAEIFGEKTPDTYRPKLLDTLGLISELNEIATEAENDDRWIYNFQYIISELELISDNDPSIINHHPQIIHLIKSLSDEHDSPARIIRKTKIAIDRLKNYSDLVRSHVSKISKNLPKNKKEALSSLQLLSSRTMAEGIDRSQCLNPVADGNLLLTSQQIIDKILETTKRWEREWTCIISLRGDKDDIRSLISKTEFKDLPKRSYPLGKKGTEFLYKTEDTIRCFKKVVASSPMDAITLALQPLRQIVDLAKFINNETPLKIHNYAFTQFEREQKIIDLSKHSYIKMPQRKDFRGLLHDFLDRIGLDNLPDRLLNALDQHTMSYNSIDLKVKFLNLWVALETFVGRSKSKSIIDKVTETICPIIVNRRIHKQIKYLAICLQNYGFCGEFPDITGHFVKSNEKAVRRDELFLALSGRNAQKVREDLCKIVLPHRLLLFRLYLLHQAISDPRELSKRLSISKTRTEWQIRRIYRARNLIVHQGANVKWLNYLYENLHYYFSTAVYRVLYDLQRNPKWSIDDSFEIQKLHFDYVTQTLKKTPETITLMELLQAGGPYKEHRPYA